jgi:transposase InsO family protein
MEGVNAYQQRELMMTLVMEPLPARISQRLACELLGLSRSSVRAEEARRTFCGPHLPASTSRQQAPQPRALTPVERTEIVALLNSDAYYDQPPYQVYHDELAKGAYHCSISSMHRLLREGGLAGERRLQRPPQQNAVPRLRAERPNEVWTWDITKLATQRHGEYLSLYVVVDLYSHFVVAWMLSKKENSALAQQLIQEACIRYGILKNQLTLHQDRGAPMTAHCYLDLLGELVVTASHSRPRVSNDNPHSESLFKTVKYQPDYPRRFDHYSHANQWCEDFFHWYGYRHHHSSLAGFTTAQVFTREHLAIHQKRQQALDESYAAHPERFVGGPPQAQLPPAVVYINPVTDEAGDIVADAAVNFSTLSRAKSMLI